MTIHYSGLKDKFWIRDGEGEGVLWFDTEAAAREYQCIDQLKMVLQREADSQRRHDEKVERLEAENERLREALRETSKQGAFEMTNIEQKALELVNEVRSERNQELWKDVGNRKGYGMVLEALCRAIEQHEAFRQEVSDIVSEVVYSTYISTPSRHKLERFIIAKPDPLVEAVNEAWGWRNPHQDVTENLRAALAKRGLEIREKGE